MKKIIAIFMTVMMILSLSTVAFAVDYDQVFDTNTLGSKTYRIPALYTLNDGSVIAAADIRYDHGSDSPNNIEVAVAKSADGLKNWEYQIVNYFDDYADNYTDTNSASFIDSAIAQSSSGRIFIVSDVQPSGTGYLVAKGGSGFEKINGTRRLLLTTGNNTDSLSKFGYYVGEFVDGMATVYTRSNSEATAYSVDSEYRLYKDGAPIYMAQKGSDKQVQQNVFYGDADLCCYSTTYLWMRYSDDNGATWSAPVILSSQVKSDTESFLGIGPGRGLVTKLSDGTERIIFAVYDNIGIFGVSWNAMENVSTIYSDDNGETWHRGEETLLQLVVGKTSEAQMVELNNGVIRMFARNSYDYIAYADSYDGGITWTKFTPDFNLQANGNCMCSFINTSKVINGKKVILGSFASNTETRADGVIKVGLLGDDNSIEWVNEYRINSGFYAYSCMTELADGNIAILYEDEAAHITYAILVMDDAGNLNEINNNNNDIVDSSINFFQKIIKFFKDIFAQILQKIL